MSVPVRKHQVFVSATFTDLERERHAVFFGVMAARQIALGMEPFAVPGDRASGVIKRVIDTSDYFVVIVAGRYGSIDPATGVSRVEQEYLHARGRGIRVLAFIRRDAAITADKMDDEPDRALKRAKLSELKATLRASHLCAEWDAADDLARKVREAILNQIQDDEADGVLPPGWVRGACSYAIASEMARLSYENRQMREELDSLRSVRAVELKILDRDAPAGTREVRVDQLRLRPRPDSRYALAPVPEFSGPRREDIEEYLARRSRSAAIFLALLNSGRTPATGVEVRVHVSNAAELLLDLDPPVGGRVTYPPLAMDARRNGTRNVTIESLTTADDGSGRVVQRVKLIAPGNDAELVPFFVVVKVRDVETPVRIEAVAIDSTGARASATLEYRLIRGGTVILDEDAYR